MEANRNRHPYQTSTNYIDGSTARKHNYVGQQAMQEYNTIPEFNTIPEYNNAVPDRQRTHVPTPQRQVPAPQRQVHRQPKHISGISKASLFVLSIAIAATLYFCIEFLMLQYQVNKMEKDIVSMERGLNTMRNENDAAHEQINMVYDLDYVYSIAVSELGMVYPNNNEVITFDKTEESYVRQYADIPN